MTRASFVKLPLLCVTVDGQFPGPTIRAKKGDRVELSVSNELSGEDGIAMHVHGIHQRGTPWMDGTLDSACPVMRGDPAFLYNFTVEHRVRVLGASGGGPELTHLTHLSLFRMPGCSAALQVGTHW